MKLEAKVDGDASNGDETICGRKSAMSDSFYYSLGIGHTEAVVLAAKRVRGAAEKRSIRQCHATTSRRIRLTIR